MTTPDTPTLADTIRQHLAEANDGYKASDDPILARELAYGDLDETLRNHAAEIADTLEEVERAKVVAHVRNLASKTTGFGTTHAQEVLVKLADAIESGAHET